MNNGYRFFSMTLYSPIQYIAVKYPPSFFEYAPRGLSSQLNISMFLDHLEEGQIFTTRKKVQELESEKIIKLFCKVLNNKIILSEKLGLCNVLLTCIFGALGVIFLCRVIYHVRRYVMKMRKDEKALTDAKNQIAMKEERI